MNENLQKAEFFQHPPESAASNPFNMRLVILQNLCNWYATEKAPSRSLYNSLQKNKACLVSKPIDTLDAARALFQKSLNREIDAVIQKFFEKYVSPAISSIQANGHEVTSTDIHGVYHRLLEEAKRMYPLDAIPSGETEGAPAVTVPSVPDVAASLPGVSLPQKLINRHIPAGLRKRKEAADSDTESDISQASAGFRKKAKHDGGTGSAKRSAVPTPASASATKAIEIPYEDMEKWNPDRIDENTIFVLGSKANGALGLSAQRGRIYIKHPGLFRYVGDHEDKMWLFENKQKTVKFGGKAFLVVLDDIIQLSETPEYKNNPDVQVDNLNGFTLPTFIVNKIKGKMVPVYDGLHVRYGGPVGATGRDVVSGQSTTDQDPNFSRAAGHLDIFSAVSPAGISDGGSDM